MTLHEYPTVEQGTDAWHELRRGIVTASTVGKLLTLDSPDALEVACPTCASTTGNACWSMTQRREPKQIKGIHDARISATAELPKTLKVADNDTSRALTTTLAAERITGWTEPTGMTADMFRGVQCEPIARDLYSGYYQQAEEFGFFLREETNWKLGFSPDGLVGTDGLLEVKSPRAKTHLRTILAGEVPAHYVAQCQAGLLVTGREWVDFCSYVGGMPLLVLRVFPDPKWFDAITAACIEFEKNVTALVAEYEGRVVGLPQTERIDFDLELVI